LTYETISAGLFAGVVGLALYGLRMRTEANNWHSNHLGELYQLQNKARARFNKEVVKFAQEVTKDANSEEEKQRNVNQSSLTTKFEDLSKILAEEKEVNDNYDAIKESRRKEGGTMAVIAIFIAFNAAILLTLGDNPLITQNANGVFEPSAQLVLIGTVVIFITYLGMEMKKYDDTYNAKIDWHQDKLKKQRIDVSRTALSQESDDPDFEG
jgi:hypothetical protein